MKHREFPHPLRLYAHRGANRVLPENTLPAFQAALRDRATHLELDVHRTKDGAIVVHHDADGLRLAGDPRRLRDCTLAEVRGWDVGAKFPFPAGVRRVAYRVPLLSEVLEAFPRTPINLDIKQHEEEVVRDVLLLLGRMNAARRVLLNSFQTKVLRAVRRLGYEGESGVSRPDLFRILLLPRFLLGPRLVRGWALQLPVPARLPPKSRRHLEFLGLPFDSARFVSRVHATGVRLDFWSINDPAEVRRFLELGADGIMTDDPALVAPAFYDFAARSGRAVDRGPD